MRTLLQYINESSDGKWFRFIFKEFKDPQIIQSISTITSNNKIYSEKIDGGIAIKIKEETKNTEKLVEVISEYINAHQNDKDKSEAVENLMNTLKDMESYIEDLEDSGE